MESELDDLNSLDAFLKALPEKLEKTPYDYNLYTQWIQLLRAVGDIDSLRSARQHMCARLAVSNDLFLEWIADEEAQPDALSDELVLKNIIDLFRMAVHERVSLIMWQRYVDFAAGLAHSHDEDVKKAASAAFDGPDYLFSVLQQAVNATSAHYLQSQALWPQYCDYIALEIKRAEGSHRDKLVDQLRNVFFERLAQPHAGLEDTFAMYSEFTTRYNEAEYEQRMIEANKVASDTRTRCTQRNAFEDDLVASNGSWSDYARYIDKLVQDNANSPKEVCMLYERALVLNCYSPEVWHDYIVYLDSLSRDKQSALEVARRAIRNCPWSGKLWAQVVYLAFLHAGYAQATQDFTQAVDTHAVDYSMVEFGHVAVAWLAVTRADTDTDSKALLAACAKCVDIAYSLDVSTADPLLFFERCCTSTVAGVVTDTEYARKLWTRICKARKSCTEAWVLSAEFERMHGSDTATRSVFRHAAQRRLDNPERLFDAWLAFESVSGDLSTLYAAERMINSQRHLIQRRMERAGIQHDVQTSDSVSTLPAKRPRTDSPEATNDNLPAADQQPQSMGAGGERGTSHSAAHGQPTDTTTVFVKGLPASYSADDLRGFLGGAGNVGSVTLLTDKHGTFHGLAKADLLSVDALVAALDKNGTNIDGRFVAVHRYKQQKPPKRASRPPREVSVVVQGFASGTSNKQIEDIAKSGGTLVRIRRNETGDTAFVVMKTLDDALGAAKVLDGCVLDGCVLTAKAANEAADTNSVPVASMSKQQGKKGTATILAPRNVATRRPAKKVNLAAKPEREPAAEGVQGGGAKSNADFRQLYISQTPRSKE